MIRSITVLGSTGSIGVQTLEVCETYGIKVEGLACGSNIELLKEQIERFNPTVVAIQSEQAAIELVTWAQDMGRSIDVLNGPAGIEMLAAQTSADLVMCAMVGMAGLAPTLAAIKGGHDVALANKEALVSGGHLVQQALAVQGVQLFPVDSEHAAIWQCLQSGHVNEIYRLWLTASGGPFRGRAHSELVDIIPQQALKHPTWQMGQKISIDSATMMNKGLEIIEACQLFNVQTDQVEVVVHPQSVIHSMVEWQDGSVVAQLSHADMRLPIQLALAGGQHMDAPLRRFNPYRSGEDHLTFEPLDETVFIAPALAKQAYQAGPAHTIVLNAANEVAVHAFLAGRIGFLEILKWVQIALDQIPSRVTQLNDLDSVLDLDHQTRIYVESSIS